MKSKITLYSLIAGVASIATGAGAATTISHGSAFTAWNAGEQANVDMVFNGVRTNKTSTLSVIAPVVRNPITAGSQTYTLTGNHAGVQDSSCTVNSILADGTGLVQKSLSALAVSGSWSRSGSMTVAELPSGSRVSVLCAIPANFGGTLAGITATP